MSSSSPLSSSSSKFSSCWDPLRLDTTLGCGTAREEAVSGIDEGGSDGVALTMVAAGRTGVGRGRFWFACADGGGGPTEKLLFCGMSCEPLGDDARDAGAWIIGGGDPFGTIDLISIFFGGDLVGGDGFSELPAGALPTIFTSALAGGGPAITFTPFGRMRYTGGFVGETERDGIRDGLPVRVRTSSGDIGREPGGGGP